MAVDLNTWVLLLIASLNAATGIVAWRTKNAVRETQKNVEVIHKATNSLTDRLLEKTDAAARAETRVDVAAEDKAAREEALERK